MEPGLPQRLAADAPQCLDVVVPARDCQIPSFQVDATIVMYRNDFHRDHRLAGLMGLLRLNPVDQVAGAVGSTDLNWRHGSTPELSSPC